MQVTGKKFTIYFSVSLVILIALKKTLQKTAA